MESGFGGDWGFGFGGLRVWGEKGFGGSDVESGFGSRGLRIWDLRVLGFWGLGA